MSDRKKIQVIIDSTVDMADRLKDRVKTVPLIVSFGDREYLDGIDLSRDDFYRELEAGQLPPKTSQPSPASFEKIFEEIHESGEEGIVITVASKLSGTYQSACLAVEDYPEISVVDSETVAVGTGILDIEDSVAAERTKTWIDLNILHYLFSALPETGTRLRQNRCGNTG